MSGMRDPIRRLREEAGSPHPARVCRGGTGRRGLVPRLAASTASRSPPISEDPERRRRVCSDVLGGSASRHPVRVPSGRAGTFHHLGHAEAGERIAASGDDLWNHRLHLAVQRVATTFTGSRNSHEACHRFLRQHGAM